MQDRFDHLQKDFEIELAAAVTTRDIELLRIKFLGRKGPIQALMQDLRIIPPRRETFCG